MKERIDYKKAWHYRLYKLLLRIWIWISIITFFISTYPILLNLNNFKNNLEFNNYMTYRLNHLKETLYHSKDITNLHAYRFNYMSKLITIAYEKWLNYYIPNDEDFIKIYKKEDWFNSVEKNEIKKWTVEEKTQWINNEIIKYNNINLFISQLKFYYLFWKSLILIFTIMLIYRAFIYIKYNQ